MHNSYHSSVMILSLTAIIVLSATLLFPLDSAFGQIASTNIDGDTIIISHSDGRPLSYKNSVNVTILNSVFTFNPPNYNIINYSNADTNTVSIVVSPSILPTTSLSLSYAHRPLNLIQVQFDNFPGSLASFNVSVTNNVVLSPPSFSSAYTDTTGSHITVVFSENIAVGSTTFLSDFAIINSSASVNSITSNNATSIILSLNSALSFGDSPLLSYNDTGTNITNSLHPTLSLANFTNQPITNNVLSHPIFVNAYTNQQGDIITVNFDREITLISTTSPTDFTVNILGIATTGITRHNDTAINLTLDSSISFTSLTSSLTLSYNQTTSNITDANNLSLANFTNQPITNNVPFFDLPSLWDTRQKITINSNQITTTLQNFTLLVSISDSALSRSSVLPNGADIIFTNSDGFTILEHEIESFTNNATTGTLVAWVRLPTLSNTSDTVLYMYYNVSSAATIIHDNVWDSDYEIIYHMD
ncbi:MAG: DUF2341 domain-containing protein [Candidatus Nitrosoabyssus spongiisocia]|nr:MAG: DUF2341 domain-containing protein [Nitrosopumilaceae archaeon AB1(1)]